MKAKPIVFKDRILGQGGEGYELVDATSESILRSEKIDLFDNAEVAIDFEQLEIMLLFIKLSWIV